jgi:hypothetical protein
MAKTPLLILGVVLVTGNVACGGTGGAGGTGGTPGLDAGQEAKAGTNYVTGTFDETTAPLHHRGRPRGGQQPFERRPVRREME